MKKFIGALLFVCVLIFYGGCKPMKSLEGKEGLFAVINTSKGDIVLELFYKLWMLQKESLFMMD